MHITHQDLIILEAVAEHGTIAAAAAKINRTRSALSQALQKLEEQVGFEIFDRTAYRLSFTQKGKDLLNRTKPILAEMQMLMRDIDMIRDGWESEICISYDDILDTRPIYDLIAEFQVIAPYINIKLEREVMNGCWDSLQEGRSALTIGVSGDPPPGLMVHQKAIGSVDFVFAVAAHHPLAQLSKVTLENIRLYPVVVVADTSVRMKRRSSGIFLSETQIIVPNIDEKIRAQLSGIGIGYLPYHRIVNDIKEGKLKEIILPSHSLRQTIIKAAWIPSTRKSVTWFVERLDRFKDNTS